MTRITADPAPHLILDLQPGEAERLQTAQAQGVDIDALLRRTLATLPDTNGKTMTLATHREDGTVGTNNVPPSTPFFVDTGEPGLTDDETVDWVNEVIREVRREMREMEEAGTATWL